MRVVVLHQYTKFEVRRTWHSEDMAHDVCQHGPGEPDFDRLTLKLVCESHLRWGTFLPNLGTLDLWVRYVRDRRTDKSNAYCRLPY